MKLWIFSHCACFTQLGEFVWLSSRIHFVLFSAIMFSIDIYLELALASLTFFYLH